MSAIEGVARAVPSLKRVRKPFFAYDLFETNQYMIYHYPDRFAARKIRVDFIYVFHDVFRDYASLFNVHKSDVVNSPKVYCPISFLFVYILCSCRTNSFAI